MFEILLGIYLLVAIALVGLVLIQQGKGADMGASFGAGASNTVFGAGGAGNFLTRSTSVLAILFFILSLVLGNLTVNRTKQGDEWENIQVPVTEQVPAVESEVPVADSAEDDSNNVPESN